MKKNSLNLLMRKPKNIGFNILVGLFFSTVIWIGVTNFIQAIKCPSMTQTQLLLHLPQTVILNFQEDDSRYAK